MKGHIRTLRQAKRKQKQLREYGKKGVRIIKRAEGYDVQTPFKWHGKEQ